MSRRARRADVAAVAGYALLACLFFWPILFTNAILTGYDTVTIFYPHRAAAARALLEGRLPLWNPDHFLGAPLLANPQVAVFYPLNWPFLSLQPGPSLAWTMALHFLLAGAFMYLFARQELGLSAPSAWLSGVIFAFGGFMGQQTGHLNQVSVAAWLPLLLLMGGRVWRSPSPRHVAACAFVVGLQFLAGHSQESYMLLAALAAYMAFLAIRDYGMRGLLSAARQAAAIAAAVVLGAALAAVQLAPTLELTRLSVRSGGLSFRQASSFSLHPQDILLALLPNFSSAPPNEMAGYVGVAGLLLAVIGARWFAPRASARFLILLAVVALLLALGRYTPVYWAAYYAVPGAGLFRVPARWLLIYSFAVAALAGMGLDVLRRRAGAFRWQAIGVIVAAGAVVVAGAVLLGERLLRLPAAPTMAVWLVIAALFILWVRALWSATTPVVATSRHGDDGNRRAPERAPSFRWHVLTLALGAAIVVELYAAGRFLEYNRFSAPESLSALRPAVAYVQTQQALTPYSLSRPVTGEVVGGEGLSRVLSVSDATWDAGDMREIEAMLDGQPASRVRDYLDAVKNKELLTANLPGLFGIQTADGYDGGVLPLRRYVDLEGLFLPPDQLSPDGRLRDHLPAIPDPRLLGLLNVGYIIADKNNDVWIDDVYYDLAFSRYASGPLALTVERPFVATAIGLMARLEGRIGAVSGARVAQITVTDAGGRQMTVDVIAGQHVPVSGQATTLRAVNVTGSGSYHHATLPLAGPIVPTQVSIRSTIGEGDLAVRGLALIDQRTGASLALPASPDVEPVHSGDVKIYRNRQTLPRAYVVHETYNLAPGEDAVTVLGSAHFDARQTVVLDQPPLTTLATPDQPARAVITHYAPEQITIEAELASPGMLIVLDTYYPGWRARVDGKEASIQRANGFFRGVELAAGQHRVEMVYRPVSLMVGAAVSLLATIVLAVLLTRKSLPKVAQPSEG